MKTVEEIRQEIAETTSRYPSRIASHLSPIQPDHGFTHIKHTAELSQSRRYVLHRGLGYATQIEINKFIPVEDPQKIAVTVFDRTREYQMEYPLDDLGITLNDQGDYHTTNWLQDPTRVERFPLLAKLLEH